MFGHEQFCLEILYFVTLGSYTSSAIIKQSQYSIEKNKGVSDISNFMKIKARTSMECASKCGQMAKCFIATYEISTMDCYVDATGCSVPDTVSSAGWNTIHKTDNCFKTCRPAKTYWQGFCQGNANANAYCLANQEILIAISMYGDQACNPSNTRLSTFPSCGKYVTDILAQECNGKLLCSVGVNVATFGSTNCGGGENLYIEYRCQWTEAYCHTSCHASC